MNHYSDENLIVRSECSHMQELDQIILEVVNITDQVMFHDSIVTFD
jgi:hypothetical protein